MKDDPCFRCKLPDCDETSPQCVIRQLDRQYWNKIRNGRHDDVTPMEHAARNERFQVYHLEKMAQASEGVRPYKRPGSPWMPGEPFDPDKPHHDRDSRRQGHAAGDRA